MLQLIFLYLRKPLCNRNETNPGFYPSPLRIRRTLGIGAIVGIVIASIAAVFVLCALVACIIAACNHAAQRVTSITEAEEAPVSDNK